MISFTLKYIVLLSITILFTACGPKSFPSDNKMYDSPKHYEYNYTSHTFFSKDKTKLYGYYIKTNSEKSKGLIVVSNGMVQNMSYRFTEWLWIVDSGYDLFIFDYRSYGRSKAEANLFGFVEDVEAALNYAHSLDRDKKIVIIGQSMGGTFVIDSLRGKKYDYLTLAVVDSTFLGFDSIMSSFLMRSILLFPFAWIPYLTVPTELNSENNVQFLETPILFITGDEDLVVNYKDSISLYEMAYVKKALWIVKGAGHVQSFNNPYVRDEFLKLLKSNPIEFKNSKKIFK